MKDKKIRILTVIAAALSVCAIIPIMFEFYEVTYSEFHFYEYGITLFTDTENWWYLLIGILGLISLLWNLVYCAYSVIDGRYRNLTWRIARYGYFYGMVAGVINFAVIISRCCDAEPAVWAFLVLVAATVAVETVLVLSKDEDTKKLSEK